MRYSDRMWLLGPGLAGELGRALKLPDAKGWGASSMSNHSRPLPRDTDQLGRENNAALLKLRDAGWDDLYHLTIDFPHAWQAVRIGEPQTVLKADSAADLRVKMRRDHESRPLTGRRPSLRGDGDA
jgi:hypothetical protein